MTEAQDDPPCTGEPPKLTAALIADASGIHLGALLVIDFYAA